MKRNIDPDFEFDKEYFAEVLKTAIGNRSIAEFARVAEVSTGYLSRYVNQKVDVAPTLMTMKKLGKASNGVTYLELLEAAGYDTEKYDDETTEQIALASPDWSPMNALLPALCRTNFRWQFVNPIMSGSVGGPISAKVEDAPFDMWYFIPVTKDAVTKEDISSILASERAEVIKPGSKVTFLTALKEVFEDISEMVLNLISLRISVALINVNEGLVCEEKYVNTAIEVMDVDKKFVLTNIENGSEGPLSL